MTGGNQLRLSSVIGGTALGRAITERHRHGVIVAGTSAGASAISTHMVAFGTGGRDAQAAHDPDERRAGAAARA